MKRLQKSILDKSRLCTDPHIAGYLDSPRFHGDLKPTAPNKHLSLNKKVDKLLSRLLVSKDFWRFLEKIEQAIKRSKHEPELLITKAGRKFLLPKFTRTAVKIFWPYKTNPSTLSEGDSKLIVELIILYYHFKSL